MIKQTGLLIIFVLIIFLIIVVKANYDVGYELIDAAVSVWNSPIDLKNINVLNQLYSFITWIFNDLRVFSFSVLFTIACAYASKYVYDFLFTPLNRVRLLGDIGYIEDNHGTSKRQLANDISRKRAVGQPPPVYPNGWFAVEESDFLKKGHVKSVCVLGLTLAVFRSEDGQAHVIDAYCPHLGANMAVGGKVTGNCIECPFHGWKFSGEDGKCKHIPYSTKIPDVAKVKSYHTLELNGFIYIWYHAESIEPTWKPPEIEEVSKGKMAYGGRSEHYVNAHIEEIPENGADISHLGQVHGPLITAGIDLRSIYNSIFNYGHHIWSGNWHQLEGSESHIGQLNLTHSIKILGKTMPFLDMRVEANQIGPGIVYLILHTKFGKGSYLQSLTPVEPMKQKVVHRVYMHWACPMIIRKFFLLGEAIQIERDIMIWNNKRYENKPVLTATTEDTMIAKHRRWYKQFYSENSPRLSFKKEDLSW